MAPSDRPGPAHHIERELKWQLAGRDLERLRQLIEGRGGRFEHLDQENRFFDTASGRLRRNGMLLRLRKENGSIVMTLKTQLAQQEHGLHQHEECECTVDESCWSCEPAELAERLPLPDKARHCIAQEDLTSLGRFSNLRLSCHLGNEEIALDTTCFPGDIVDHELEVETDDPHNSRQRWQAALREIGCPAQEQTQSKYARYRRISEH